MLLDPDFLSAVFPIINVLFPPLLYHTSEDLGFFAKNSFIFPIFADFRPHSRQKLKITLKLFKIFGFSQ